MNIKDLDIALAEANRFLAAAKELKGKVSFHYGGKQMLDIPQGTRLNGYVRRASLDLSMALAKLRKW